jgi:hypothetical protein
MRPDWPYQQTNRPLYQGMGVGPWSLSIYAKAYPPGTYLRIAPRSGLVYKYGMDVSGVIDADYLCSLFFLKCNYSSLDFDVNPGDRISQAILEKICVPGPIVDVRISERLPRDRYTWIGWFLVQRVMCVLLIFPLLPLLLLLFS